MMWAIMGIIIPVALVVWSCCVTASEDDDPVEPGQFDLLIEVGRDL